ncbi:MAG: spermidine/putrescine ABC transporter substrate-binding protein, partial [Nonomuraea sp.]|nr:spermidine/putrescine ABC transporter substrate-binding protein [Nonomuraea sp.]
MRPTRYAITAAALALATACGGTTTPAAPGRPGFTPPKIPALTSLGAGEGQVNLVAWAGYVEDG